MQFLKKGDKTVLLDRNEVYTLERAVDTLAMSVFEDYIALKRDEPNSNNEKVTEERIMLAMDVLNSLSGALSATNSETR
ncbi:MAG: hypothetical protein KH304_16855 [Clostridium sp.]|nr:hypothetical protein [Clostridium sp.]